MTTTPDFRTRLAFTGIRLLGLDYDGTLDLLSVDKSQAYPLPGTAPRLSATGKMGQTFVAIVYGCPVAGLSLLSGNLHVTFIGSNAVDDVF